jgi:hypothetical protein
MPVDYTDAPPPQFDLIPQDTIATVSTHIRAGGVGEDGMLKRSKAGDCEMLDLEFTILDGKYKGRKFWTYLIIVGTTEGQIKAVESSRGTLKAILDSALGLKPNDVSAEARAARTVSLKKFDGMAFMAKIAIEKGGAKKEEDGGGFWADKNVLGGVVTPDKPGWQLVEQPPPFNGGAASSGASSTPAVPVERPGWA